MIKKKREKELPECPMCGQKTLKYDPELGMNRCYNQFCDWQENTKGSYLCLSFLESCLRDARTPYHRQYIERIIQEKKKNSLLYKL